jgi:DNA repair protein RecO (recombination protein O)
MTLVVTDALVLHAFDYLESSRIVRLLTREAGVRSALARGARRSSRRFGTSLDLFAQGSAQLHTKAGRELDTLAGFDVAHARPAIGTELERFAGASMIAELTLRFARDGADADVYFVVTDALDAIAGAGRQTASRAALEGAWRVITSLGFAPLLDECVECHAAVSWEDDALFSHSQGGVICLRCSQLARVGRRLPAAARRQLAAWVSGEPDAPMDHATIRAHQRLLREFLQEHLDDGRPLKAFDLWESTGWSAA